jgi:hypothetical protein
MAGRVLTLVDLTAIIRPDSGFAAENNKTMVQRSNQGVK